MLAPVAAVALLASQLVALPATAATIDVRPGESIQAAINSASPGDTIVVHPGVYHQNVNVNKNRIKLEGSGASVNGTVLVPPKHPKGPNGGTGIGVFNKVDFKTGAVLRKSRGVQVSGFLVRGFRDFGIFFYGAVGFVASHNKAVNNGGYGISGFHLHKGKFLYNVATGSEEAGFYTGDSPKADFVTRGNVASGNQFGYLMRDAQHGVVTDNRFYGNCVGAVILDTGSPGRAGYWTLRNNDVYHNDKLCPKSGEVPFNTSGTGLTIFGGQNNVIGRNRVWANRPSAASPVAGGIVLHTGAVFGGHVESGNAVRFNVAYRNSPADIRWDGKGSANTFTGNKCKRSQPGGLCH
jgi:hypothetical protein